MKDSIVSLKTGNFTINQKVSLSIIALGFIYWFYDEPEILTFFLASFIISLTLGSLLKLSFNHCLIIAAAITMVLSYQTAAHAVIFDSLEQAMTEVITATGGTVSTTVVTGFFAFLRVVIGIGFIVGIIMAIVRATSGADWAPVVTALGIAVFGVISIEVMSNLLVGAS